MGGGMEVGSSPAASWRPAFAPPRDPPLLFTIVGQGPDPRVWVRKAVAPRPASASPFTRRRPRPRPPPPIRGGGWGMMHGCWVRRLCVCVVGGRLRATVIVSTPSLAHVLCFFLRKQHSQITRTTHPTQSQNHWQHINTFQFDICQIMGSKILSQSTHFALFIFFSLFHLFFSSGGSHRCVFVNRSPRHTDKRNTAHTQSETLIVMHEPDPPSFRCVPPVKPPPWPDRSE